MSDISPTEKHMHKGSCLCGAVQYEITGSLGRVFCGTCGSSIIGKRESMPEIVRVRIGTLDTPLETKVSAHIFVGSKAEWYDIHDDVPRHEERP